MATTRRLAAIMFTDTVGYTASTQMDEARTLELLRNQGSLLRPILASHHGREVKSTGDGFLVEFESALEATRCAIEIQKRLHQHNLAAAEGSGIQIRIGIHLGDVVHAAGDVLGDSVNIASRIEPLAEPGGVCVSEPVFGQVRNKIPDQFVKLEPVSLKGVRFPIDVYRVVLPWSSPDLSATITDLESKRLAVLPFANISPDPNDAYFSDGLTEEMISVLSQLAELRVIARTSVNPYKTAPKPIPQVGLDLGVTWVLEGSVRKAGTRLRISVQLIDVRSQEHVWAQTYDRELNDVFALQSEMAREVAEALKITLLDREKSRLDRRAPPQPQSYLEYLRGRTSLHGVTEAGLREAKQHFERAVSLDDHNAAAHAGLADIHRILGSMYHHLPKPAWEAAGRRHAARAIELDPDLAEAHTSLALGHYDAFELGDAEKEFRWAIALNPSFAWAHQWYADLLADLGRPEEALREFAIAEQLDPLSALILGEEVQLLTVLRRLDVAEAQLEKLGRVEGFGILYHDRRAFLYLARGDLELYRQEVHGLKDLLPGRPEVGTADATYFACVGQGERAREALRPIEQLPEPIRPVSQIAWVYALLGDLDTCFHWLNVAVETQRLSPRMWRFDPTVARVREDPRFRALLGRMNLA